MKLFNELEAHRSALAITVLLGKLGIECCIRHGVTTPGWSGPGGKPYIKYGLTQLSIHEFMERMIRGRKRHRRTQSRAPRKRSLR